MVTLKGEWIRGGELYPYLRHLCGTCGFEYQLPRTPGFAELVSGERWHISIAEYVYVNCPQCGVQEWATERRFLGFLGPQGFYRLNLYLAAIAVGAVLYILVTAI